MKHRFHTPLSIIRVVDTEDADGFTKRKPMKVGEYRCSILKTETTEKLDEKPVLFVIKKTIGLPKEADVQLGDEISLLGRRYLVIDIAPHRYWKEISVTCEVKGSEHS
jgi:hypothetical protein